MVGTQFDINGAAQQADLIEQFQAAAQGGDATAQQIIESAKIALGTLGVPPDVADDPMAIAAMKQGNIDALRDVMPDIVGSGDVVVTTEQLMSKDAPEFTTGAALWGDESPTIQSQVGGDSYAPTDVAKMDAEAIQERSHTTADISDAQLANAESAISQRVAEIMANNPGIGGQELLAEVQKGLALPPNLDTNLVAQIVEKEETKNMDMANMMNQTPAGASLAQEADQEKGSGMLTGLFAGLAGLGAVVAKMKDWVLPGSQNDVQDMSLASLGDLTPNVQGVGTQSIGMNGPGSGPMLG